MSVKIMGLVWDLELPYNEKFVLLAYADHASHDGTNIYPAVASIAKKTGYTERSIQLITRQLEEKGLLVPDGRGPHGTNKWKVGGEIFSPVKFAPVKPDAKGGEIDTGKGVNPTSPESSLSVSEPSSFAKVGGRLPIDWKIAAGQPVTEEDFGDDPVESLIRELEVGLRLNIDRSLKNQAAAKRILRDGRPVSQWLLWVKSDKWRAEHLNLYRQLDKVWGEWPQAFRGNQEFGPDVDENPFTPEQLAEFERHAKELAAGV